jgi:transcriptional regulator with XRE-family HTH domain
MQGIREVLSQNLIQLRKRQGLTQVQLSEKLVIPVQSYNQYEKQKTWPSSDVLEKIAAFYGIPPAHLFTTETRPASNDEAIALLKGIVEKLKNS